MRRFALALLVASTALAGGNGVSSGGFNGLPPGSSSVTPSGTPNVVQATTAPLTFYVDPTGNDSNACTATGTAACLTIQGALNKSPRMLRHQVTVSVAAGSYAGALVSGFFVDPSFQQANGGLLIDGALATSTLATGSATGTAAGAGQSTGSGSTFGTLCDPGATWTVSDLVGRFITTTSPANATRVITANTATCITIAGTWLLPVAGSTTYTVQDPSVIVTGAVTGPASPVSSSSANRAAFIFTGNDFSYQNSACALRNMRIANATGFGVAVAGGGGYRIEETQLRTGSATSQPLVLGGSTNVGTAGAFSAPQVTLINVDLSINANLIGVNIHGGMLQVQASLLRNATSSNTAIVGASNAGAFSGLGIFTQNQISGWANGIGAPAFALSVIGGAQAFTGNRISCGSAGVALGLTSVVSAATSAASVAFGPITNTNIDTCGTAIMVPAGSVADVVSLTGSVATTGFDLRYGGVVLYTKAGVTLTAGANEIDLDSGGLTAAFADVTAGSCVSTAPQASRVCAR